MQPKLKRKILNKYMFLRIICFIFLPLGLFAQQPTRENLLLGKLSPERACYDVRHYALEARIDPERKFIKGKNTILFSVLEDFEKLQIDLHPSLKVTAITQGKNKLTFTRQERAVFVKFPKKQKKGTTQAIAVSYEGNPITAKNAPWDGGFVWKKSASGNHWVGVACQGIGASIWYPNKDHWSDKPDSVSVALEVPNPLVAVSNGNLYSTQKLKDNFTRYTWKTSYPINNYNVTLNIGDYQHFTDEYVAQDGQKLALDYYVLTENLEKAKKQFQQVKPMLACYEKLFGKYPFWNDGYALVETPYLGMEHQGAIAYGNQYNNGYLGGDLTGTGIGKLFDFIIIHETGHEYWGNSVSADDRADMWIHEAFCTYGEALYVECLYGKEKAFTYANGWKNIVYNDKPIVAKRGENEEGSSVDMYSKGALMLHTLRNVVNDDALWLQVIKDFSLDFRGKITNTEAVIDYFNQKTKKTLTSIFRQYLYYTTIPTFEYKIADGKFQYRFVAQEQNFQMPIVVEFGSTSVRLNASTSWNVLEDAKLISQQPFKIRTDLFFVGTKANP
jgi:aminopeptidase N